MIAKELRIGNYFKDYAGRIETVTIKTLVDIESIGYNDAEYIQINEDYLLRFGFIHHELYNTYNKDGISIYINDRKPNVSLFNEPIELFFIHELQNLYYAIYKEELECSL